MTPGKIFDILDLAKRARNNDDIFNPLFVSAPGLGKTEIVQQWCVKNNLPFVVLSLSSYDPPDFKGFPTIKKIDGREVLTFATPEFWPASGQGVIILEELNRTPSSIMQCILSLADIRRGFDGYRLPEGWMIVGCINPENEDYEVTAMDPALKDRFEMFHISYDKKTFLNYIQNKEWNKDIVNFVEGNIWTYVSPERIANNAKYVSPRTLSKVNSALKAGVNREDELFVYESLLGLHVGKDFYNFRHDESPVMVSDLKKNLKASLKKLEKFSNLDDCKNGMISFTIRDIINEDSVEQIEDSILVPVLKVLPVEQGIGLIRELEFKRDDKKLLDKLCADNKDLKQMFKSVVYNAR